MTEPNQDYRDSLLFRHCKTEEAYRAALASVARNQRQDEQRWRWQAITPLCPMNEGPPPPRPLSPPAEPTDKLKVFVAYLESACQTYPDKMREILAPLLLDILEEYQHAED